VLILTPPLFLFPAREKMERREDKKRGVQHNIQRKSVPEPEIKAGHKIKRAGARGLCADFIRNGGDKDAPCHKNGENIKNRCDKKSVSVNIIQHLALRAVNPKRAKQ
jgi:hypothetical protein